MKKSMVFILSLGLVATQSFAGCFKNHIKESISINTSRKKVYSQLTDGRSDEIYNRLIRDERILLATSSYFDHLARPYQKNGMDLFCREFRSMVIHHESDLAQKNSPSEQYMKFDWEFYKEKLTVAIKNHDIKEIKTTSLEAIIELRSQPETNCLTRHLIESIYRFAYFLPRRAVEAREKKLVAPSKLMFTMMKMHIKALEKTNEIDLLSQPIQMSGIPILCSELPDLLSDLEIPELEILKY